MADLVLTADVSSIRDAEKALKRFSDASEKLGRSVLNTANKVQSVSSGWDQANKLYKQGVLNSKALAAAQTELARELATLNGYTKSNGALNTQRALAELKAAQAARESARATEEAARAAQQAAQRQNELRMRYQEGYAAFARARNEMRGLREAMRAGIITTDQYRERVRLLREELARQNGQSNRNTRGIGQSSTMIQQAGYQFGDFAVQVQSGTNAFVAFGQQATQLAGTLTLVQGRVPLLGMSYLALGTALGVVIPLVTAYLAYTQRASGATKKLKDSLDDLNETNKLLEDFGKNFGRDLIGNIEAVRVAFGDLVADVYEAQIKQVQTKLKSLLSDKTAVQATQIQITGFEGLAPEQLQKQLEQVLFIKEQFARLTATEVTSQSELNALYDNVYRTLKDSGQINESGLAVLRGIAAENGIVLGLMQSQVDAADRTAEARQKSLRDDLVQKLDRELQLQREIAYFGKDSLEVADLRLKFQKEDLVAQAKKLGFSKDEISALIEKLRLTEKVRKESEKAEFSDKRIDNLREEAELMGRKMSLLQAEATAEQTVRGILMERMGAKDVELKKMVRLGDLTKDQADAELDAFYAAQEKTLQYEMLVKPALEFMEAVRDAKGDAETLAGLDLSPGILAAAQAAGVLSDELADALGSAMAMAAAARAFRKTDPMNIPGEGVYLGYDTEAGAYKSRIKELQKEYRDSLKSGRKGRGGGGKDPAEAAAEYLEKLQREAEFKLQLVGLSEQEQRGMEIKKQYLETLEQDNRKLTEAEQARIDAILKSEEALKKATEAEQRREAIQQTISSNIENALMAVVDGTQSVEDAFKSMLRNILLEIYRTMIAQPIAQGITSFLGFANGGAFSGGNVVPFASGGVVGGPTFFPMSGGKTGLMGEAGPEAIMPLKRGSDGKLGVEGGGNVTVQQTFNFAANGDESVKRIIAEAAPKIANLTQKQILDSRRRGGTMKATFG